MVQMAMRHDHAVNRTEIDVATELRERASAKIDDDVGRPALDEIAAAPLSGIGSGGTAAQYSELHAFPFLSIRALRALASRIVTEAARRRTFDGPFSRHLYSARRL